MGWGPLPGARGGGKRMATLGLRGQHVYASDLLRILPASSVAASANVSLSLSCPSLKSGDHWSSWGWPEVPLSPYLVLQ